MKQEINIAREIEQLLRDKFVGKKIVNFPNNSQYNGSLVLNLNIVNDGEDCGVIISTDRKTYRKVAIGWDDVIEVESPDAFFIPQGYKLIRKGKSKLGDMYYDLYYEKWKRVDKYTLGANYSSFRGLIRKIK